jgi:hypothetical protein
MNRWKVGTLTLFVFVFALTGCAKKSTEQASITGTGFDSITSTEELAQLPQASTASSQQAGVEVLPIETSPITQGVPPIAGPTSSQAGYHTTVTQSAASTTTATGSLTREQQIQTALQNAGLYSGAVDGKIGPVTKRAIEEFQKNNNLQVDGKVGPKTWAAMDRYLNGSSSSDSGNATMGTQTTSID